MKNKKTIDIDSQIYHYQKLVLEAYKNNGIDMQFLDNIFYMLLRDFKKIVADEVIGKNEAPMIKSEYPELGKLKFDTTEFYNAIAINKLKKQQRKKLEKL